jgi:hypothetical protein
VALLGVASPHAWAARCDIQNDPITLAETQQMDYGTIGAASAGGTVTISPTGAITVPGGYTASGVAAPGKFRITGKKDCAVLLGLFDGSLSGPGTAMTLHNFTTNAGGAPTLDHSTGALNFNVGADLVVNANQAGGSYSGTYFVVVIYN